MGHNAASLLAALAIVPALYALAPAPQKAASALGSGSQGLVFIWIPTLLSRMPAGGGAFSALFFLPMSFAAFSSLISISLYYYREPGLALSHETRFSARQPSGCAGTVFCRQQCLRPRKHLHHDPARYQLEHAASTRRRSVRLCCHR